MAVPKGAKDAGVSISSGREMGCWRAFGSVGGVVDILIPFLFGL